MTIVVKLNDKAAEIIERQVAEGHYPDAESAVAAAVTLLDDVALDWSDVDTAAVRALIAESDAEGGELTRDEVVRHLDVAIGSAHRR